ncbi:hypothetical protein [Paraburkholderia aromaticivorans]|jgi:hypothetical protein|uniref:hypothetical protein n=1 Tax=Paraburkholderia aromaticivorans TaxID=2026199 RepID=UPI0038BD3093
MLKMNGPLGEKREVELRLVTNINEEPSLGDRVAGDDQDNRAFCMESDYDWMNNFFSFSTTDW